MTSHDPRRRRFLRQLSALGGAVSLPSGLWLSGCRPGDVLEGSEDTPSFTAQRAPHYFVFYYMMGGWDITLTSDPLDAEGDISVDYNALELWERGGHRWGPAMSPLRPFMDKMAVIRGMKAIALNHPQARFNLVTGHFKKPGQQPRESVQTILASHIGRGYPMPNLSSDGMRPATFLGELDPHVKPIRIGSVNQLRGLSRVKGDVAEYEQEVRDAIRERDAAFLERNGDNDLARDFHTYAELARELRESDYKKRALRSGKPVFAPTRLVRTNNRWGKQAHLAAEVIKQDLAPMITVGSGEFDSHNKHDYKNHRRAVTRGMETVAAICDGLSQHRTADGETLMDRTTVVVTSEFSRAPWINELGGKHHWDANAVILIGKGVKGTPGGVTVFNKTDGTLFPQPVNPSNGQVDRKADDLVNGHYLATVLAMAGVDPGRYFAEDPILPVLG
jgi:hypothetical protein